MLLRRPARHVEADLTNDLQGAMGIDAFNAGEIDAGDAEEVRTSIKGWFVTMRLAFAGHLGQRLSIPAILEGIQVSFKASIALGHLRAVEVEQLNGLLKGKEMVLTPVTVEGKGDRGLVIFAAPVTQIS